MMVQQDEYEGLRVLVTGGSRGIGKAIVLHFVQIGVRRIAVIYKEDDVSAGTLEESVRARPGIELFVHKADVSHIEDLAPTIDSLKREWGGIDVLVNNAGICRDKTLEKMSVAQWNEVLQNNLTGCFNGCRLVVSMMKRLGFGRIINISSVIAEMGNIGQVNYAASKAGIIGLTKSLALEVAHHGITANCVCPGFIDTALLSSVPPSVLRDLLERIPVKRLGRPQEVARMVAFLASRRSGYITGQCFNVNGGLYM